MPKRDPLQITSKRPSSLKNFREVAISGNSVISSNKINVLPSMNFLEGSKREMFFIISLVE